ncbi:MAG: ABC transporter substrate-binding protein [Candidatus Heimdallarchaeum endolithica]|uniref:ABC transporter substrate-binding protein n=1 Tax=Candidatus Heimdallarchaeum endolithica TaxID=2876572 RepID=A0A9Y1BSG3_9ARCH|nr:MAG: ABC transporter substrate-binding protein [Candidatus Heimdallarchaeum endolithica]
MKIKKNHIKELTIFFSLFLSLSLISADTAPIFFDITIISPNTCPARNQWEPLLDQILPQIGINVTHEYVHWGFISERTWNYPVGEEGYEDHIPSYEKGGYDILTIGWGWDFDWDPTGLFDSASIVPNGDNLYQYNSSEFDNTLEEYLSEFELSKRIEKAKELQSILYNDLPAITVFYPREKSFYLPGVSNVDFELLYQSIPRTEYWKNSEKNNITYMTYYDFNSPNLFLKDNYIEEIMGNIIFYGLFERAQNTHLYEPVIAQNYSISEDKKTIIVDINPDAYFSNGDPVTAYDVDFSYELFMTPGVRDDPYSYYDTYDLLTTYFENNDSIKAIDDNTVQLEFKKPYVFWQDLLSIDIVNKKLFEEYIEDNGYNFDTNNQSLFIGAGPFTLNVTEDYDLENQTVTFHKNEYWKLTETVELDSIIFLCEIGTNDATDKIENKEIDIADTLFRFLDILENNTEWESTEIRTGTQTELTINMRHPILGTGELTPLGTAEAANNIRRAISHSINREQLIEEVLDGIGKPGVVPYPELCIGFDTSLSPYSYNITLAKSLMEEAGYSFEQTTPEETAYPVAFILSLLGITIIFSKRSR